MSTFTPLLITFLILFSLISMGATSGIWSEKSGIVNIAIEGGFIVGAFFFSILNSNEAFVNTVGPFATYVGAAVATIAGAAFAMLLAIPAINFKADNVVVGTGLNILAAGISLFVVSFIFNVDSLKLVPETSMNIYTSGGSTLNGHHIIIAIIAIIVAGISWFALNKSSFGLRVRTAGENPKSLEEVGISVKKVRYQAILISGAISGLAGMSAVMYTSSNFNGTALGMGFVALAVMIMGRRKIVPTLIFAAAFSLLFAGIPQIDVSSTPGLRHIIGMIPFIVPIVVLALAKIFKYDISDPKSLGRPYEKGQR